MATIWLTGHQVENSALISSFHSFAPKRLLVLCAAISAFAEESVTATENISTAAEICMLENEAAV